MGYLLASLMAYCVQNISNKEFGRRFPRSFQGTSLQLSIMLTFSALLLGIFGGAVWMDNRLMLLALGFSAAYTATVYLLMTALSLGPVGHTCILSDVSLFIPVLYGIFRYGDRVSLAGWAGMAMILLAAYLLTDMSDKKAAVGKLWVLTAVGSGLTNGVANIMKKMLTWEYSGASPIAFVFWGFLFSAGICWLITLALLTMKKDFTPYRKPALPVCSFFSAVGTAFGNAFLMLSLEALPASFVYSALLGGLPVLMWLVSFFWYREIRINLRGAAAIFIFTCGAVIQNLYK